jgi:hypothetical protein
VVVDPTVNRFPHLMVISEVIDASVDWKEYVRKLAADR